MPSLESRISSSRRALEERRGMRSLAELESAVARLEAIRPFTESIVGEEIAFVLEVHGFDEGALEECRDAGVAGLFVTSDEVLPPVAEATTLPILHGGVLIDPYQLYESRLAGADGVVLIAPAFDYPHDLSRMHETALGIGLDVVVEVDREEEVDTVLESVDPDSFLIRNHERDGAIDLEQTFSLLEEVPAGKVVLALGGMRTREEVAALERSGVDALILERWAHEQGLRATLEVLRGAR